MFMLDDGPDGCYILILEYFEIREHLGAFDRDSLRLKVPLQATLDEILGQESVVVELAVARFPTGLVG